MASGSHAQYEGVFRRGHANSSLSASTSLIITVLIIVVGWLYYRLRQECRLRINAEESAQVAAAAAADAEEANKIRNFIEGPRLEFVVTPNGHKVHTSKCFLVQGRRHEVIDIPTILGPMLNLNWCEKCHPSSTPRYVSKRRLLKRNLDRLNALDLDTENEALDEMLDTWGDVSEEMPSSIAYPSSSSSRSRHIPGTTR